MGGLDVGHDMAAHPRQQQGGAQPVGVGRDEVERLAPRAVGDGSHVGRAPVEPEASHHPSGVQRDFRAEMEAPSGQVHDVEVATLVTRVAQQAAHSLGVGLGGRAEMEHGVVHRSFAFGQAKLRFFRETREGVAPTSPLLSAETVRAPVATGTAPVATVLAAGFHGALLRAVARFNASCRAGRDRKRGARERSGCFFRFFSYFGGVKRWLYEKKL